MSGKDVAQVNCRNFIARLLHKSSPRLIMYCVVIGAIEIVEVGGYVLPCHIAGGIIHFESSTAFFLMKGSSGLDVSRRHLLVHSVFGQLEDVGGPVVAIHAIHHAILSFFQLLLSWLGIGGNEFGRLPLIVGVIDDWNRLPLNIGGDVADPPRRQRDDDLWMRQSLARCVRRLSAVKRRFAGVFFSSSL